MNVKVADIIYVNLYIIQTNVEEESGVGFFRNDKGLTSALNHILMYSFS